MLHKYLNKKLNFIPPSADTQFVLFKINWNPLESSKDGECRRHQNGGVR